MTQPRVDRKRHLLAYRARMRIVGNLESCICTWPLDKTETETEHDVHCPTHRMILRGSPVAREPAPAERNGAGVIAAMNEYAASMNRSPES